MTCLGAACECGFSAGTARTHWRTPQNVYLIDSLPSWAPGFRSQSLHLWLTASCSWCTAIHCVGLLDDPDCWDLVGACRLRRVASDPCSDLTDAVVPSSISSGTPQTTPNPPETVLRFESLSPLRDVKRGERVEADDLAVRVVRLMVSAQEVNVSL